MEYIINYWRELNFKEKPFIHPSDKEFVKIRDHYNIKNYEELVSHTEFGKIKNKLHLNLLPEPYSGDLKNATVYILFLNPGFSILDYYAESKKEVRQSLITSLRQEFVENEEYPLFWLNPKYLWTAGGQWVEKKFKDLLHHLVNNHDMTYIDALRHISNKVALIELVPYHSNSFGLRNREMEMKSVTVMREFVKNTLLTKAKNNVACIIQTRSVREWDLNLPTHKNIIIYKKGQTRSASLSKKSDAWSKMNEFILK